MPKPIELLGFCPMCLVHYVGSSCRVCALLRAPRRRRPLSIAQQRGLWRIFRKHHERWHALEVRTINIQRAATWGNP